MCTCTLCALGGLASLCAWCAQASIALCCERAHFVRFIRPRVVSALELYAHTLCAWCAQAHCVCSIRMRALRALCVRALPSRLTCTRALCLDVHAHNFVYLVCSRTSCAQCAGDHFVRSMCTLCARLGRLLCKRNRALDVHAQADQRRRL